MKKIKTFTLKNWYIFLIIGLVAGIATFMVNPGDIDAQSGETPPRWFETYDAELEAIDNFIDTEITTIDGEIGVIDDSLNLAITGRACPPSTIDGRLGLPFITNCTTVDGGTAAWAQGTDYAIFSVVGTVYVKIVGVVTNAITEANGDETVSIGTTGIAGNIMVAEATPATDWGVAGAPVIGSGERWMILDDTEVDVQVLGTTSINDGVIIFYAIWYPITSGAAVDSTGWD